MNAQITALLALQADDAAIRAFEDRLAAIAPRLAHLEAERLAAEKALAGARAAVEREEERHGTLSERAGDYRRLTERAQSASDRVDARHAAQAGAQYDIARRALTEAEAELNASAGRLTALHGAVSAAEARVAAVAAEQEAPRAAAAAERGQIEGELRGALERRGQSARAVDGQTLARYDKVRQRRRGPAVYAVRTTPRGFSCASCDTAVATQRRTALSQGAIDVCEGCGVLLYAPPQEPRAEDDAPAAEPAPASTAPVRRVPVRAAGASRGSAR